MTKRYNKDEAWCRKNVTTPMVERPELMMLREAETKWLADELGIAIASLGYPVGMGIAPHPETLEKAANKLFNRYAKMIELAAQAGAAIAKEQ